MACVKIPHFLDSVNLMRTWNLFHSSANKYFSCSKLIGNSFFLFFFLLKKIPGNGERYVVMTETNDKIKNWEFWRWTLRTKFLNQDQIYTFLPGFKSLQIYLAYLCLLFPFLLSLLPILIQSFPASFSLMNTVPTRPHSFSLPFEHVLFQLYSGASS